MCPGNRVQGRNYPQTAGGRESAAQEKPGEVRARQGMSPSVGDRTEIPTKSRNPYTRGSQCWQGQTVVAENLFSDGKTILGVRNACRNPHRAAADSLPSLPELNNS